MLPVMLRRDRERWGMSLGEAGWRFRDDVAVASSAIHERLMS
jgi:hypothetical protein